MRLRAAAVSAGIVALAVTSMSAPAQAAPAQPTRSASANWIPIASYTTQSRCVDAGQQYVREGFHEYRCIYTGLYPPYALSVR
ncbi:hypothetical protein [Actinomadura macrotermitis]|uniref:Uncharacterized protein n=1 Tax=Actinomadura macrotermitis TaxID=2585200 RepID=A0A7K0BQD2_9ACTN|nr:hypothetical protein [Actinomadura macrotermitis]MQY03347.1 hypothetical protein [Actinomadura macrotermitis]